MKIFNNKSEYFLLSSNSIIPIRRFQSRQDLTMKQWNENINSSICLRDRFIAGDNDAYAELYKMYAKDLYSFGLSLRVKSYLIEDAIHDIFEEIYSSRKNLINVENLKFYFISAFRNRLFYLLKKEQNTVGDIDIYIQQLTEENHLDLWLEKEASDEKKILLSNLLNKLNVNQREIIHLRFVEGLSLDEISLLKNINNQSVKNLIYRAIKNLNKLKSKALVIMILWVCITQILFRS